MNGTLLDTGFDVTNFKGDVSGNMSGLIEVIVFGLIKLIEELLVFSKVVSGNVLFKQLAEIVVYIEDKLLMFWLFSGEGTSMAEFSKGMSFSFELT